LSWLRGDWERKFKLIGYQIGSVCGKSAEARNGSISEVGARNREVCRHPMNGHRQLRAAALRQKLPFAGSKSNFRLSAESGLNSEIAACPKSANRVTSR
jgi:hypothetical protein